MDGDLSTDYWDGFGISYDDWYAGGRETVDTWENVEAVFERKDGVLNMIMSTDFTCRNVSAFQGATGAAAVLDAGGNTFYTANGAWGFFLKGYENSFTISNGTLSVKKAVNVGDDGGIGDTLTIGPGGVVAWPESVAVGRGGASEGNRFVVDGGMVLLDNGNGHSNWGMVAGEHDGENGNAIIVCNGGIVSNTASAFYVGQNSSSNVLDVQSGGCLYRTGYSHLARVDDAQYYPQGNMMRVEGEGSLIFINSQFVVGENVSTVNKNGGNKVWAGDHGEFRVANDFQLYSSGNEVVVSNGVIRVVGGGFRLATEENNGVTGNRLTVAGKSPWLRAGYDFKAVNGAKLKFVVPAGGYTAPAQFDDDPDAYPYAPVTSRTLLTIGADTTLEVDVTEFQEGLTEDVTIPLMSCMSMGNALGLAPETVAVWNASMPEGCTVSVPNYDQWGVKTVLLTVKKPKAKGSVFILL